MKRFLKVILILAAVFGATGLGLTAGGAAMGATMGDIGALDNGITQILHILDDKDGWDEENSEAAMDGQDEDLVADAEYVEMDRKKILMIQEVPKTAGKVVPSVAITQRRSRIRQGSSLR